MTTGGNCCHTRQQFAARPKQHCGFRDGRDAPLDIGDESPPEVFGHGQPRQIRLIADKERPVILRNINRRLGEGARAIGTAQVADVVGMGMRNHDGIDVIRLDTDRGKVREKMPTIRTQCLRRTRLDQDFLPPLSSSSVFRLSLYLSVGRNASFNALPSSSGGAV